MFGAATASVSIRRPLFCLRLLTRSAKVLLAEIDKARLARDLRAPEPDVLSGVSRDMEVSFSRRGCGLEAPCALVG